MAKVMRALCLLTLAVFLAAPMVTTAGQDVGTLAMSKTPEKPMKAVATAPARIAIANAEIFISRSRSRPGPCPRQHRIGVPARVPV